MSLKNPAASLGAALICLAAALWAVDGVVLTPRLGSLPVPFVVLLLHAIPFVLMHAFLWRCYHRLRRMPPKGWLALALVSCTGGLITHRLTNVPGSSDYLDRALIVYSNRAQKELLAMPASILSKHGAVSPEAAAHMAKEVKRLSKSTIGLAVTGIAGPGGGTAEKPVGTVFIGLSHKRQVTTHRHQFYGDREQIKSITSQYALDHLRKLLIAGEMRG